jgi:transcriptional regulator with XRE-family HTH domain
MSEIVDVYIGKRLRWRRRSLGLTQTELASTCGLRFQQIHKYETATNHMSAAMLWRVSVALGVEVQYFYEGLSQANTSTGAAGSSLAPGSAEPVQAVGALRWARDQAGT